MRFARAPLVAAMASTSIAAAVLVVASPTKYDQKKNNGDNDNNKLLQKELSQLTNALQEISREQSWSSDTPPSLLSSSSNDNDHNSSTNSFFQSIDKDEEEVRIWMEQKEKEVQSYYTLLSNDEEKGGRRSSMAVQNNGGGDDDGHHAHFLKMTDERGGSGRRQLRVVTTEQQQQQQQQTPPSIITTTEEEVERELGKGVGMKRTDSRVVGRFTPEKGRTPPGGRDRESPSVGGDGQQGEMMASVTESSDDDNEEPRTPSRTKTTGDRGSDVAVLDRNSIKSMMKQPPSPPPPPPLQQQSPPQNPNFPNAVYVLQPPVVKEGEVEECYDIEELEAMGIVVQRDEANGWEGGGMMEVVVEEEEEEEVEVEQEEEEVMMTRSSAPIYRYDGTLLSRKPGSRRTLQQYTYWAWDGKAAKGEGSAKSAKTQTVYAAQQPPPSQTVYILNSKSGKSSKSKSSKYGKVTKSGKVCQEVPLPTPPLPSVCGMDLADAASKCDNTCTTDADCTGMELCIANVAACAAASSGYCGSNVNDASKCDVACTSDAGCPSGESCFVGGVVECSSTDDDKLGYCGANALDAGKCTTVCTSDLECAGGESCYSNDVVECSTPGYCGVDLDDATKCATECTSDGDCPGGESCFVGGGECKPGYCGTDAVDATKCDVPCSSDAGCAGGETCFTDVKCAAETRCPTGCKDCDPDSPLPCPDSRMKQVCDKQNNELYPPGDPRAEQRISNFKDCYDMCKPSFCCIHASQSKVIAPTCAKEYENCPLYYPCYIIWWKLHDTIGPAPYLRVEQKEPFFNVNLNQLEDDFENDPTFFNQVFGHHFNDDEPLTDDRFEDPENW